MTISEYVELRKSLFAPSLIERIEKDTAKRRAALAQD